MVLIARPDPAQDGPWLSVQDSQDDNVFVYMVSILDIDKYKQY